MTATLTAVPPRFRFVPTYSTSAGQDAIDLAELAGVHLFEWQREVLIAALAEGPNGKWASRQVGLIVPRQNGKGEILVALELFMLFLEERCRLITHTAHRFDTCLDHFRRIRAFIEDTPELLERVKDNGRGVEGPSGIKDSNGKESIELADGCRLNFKAREKGSGRGFSGDLVVLDEAFYLKDLSGLVPTLSARVNPQIWVTSSAPIPGEVSDRLRRTIREGRGLATGEIEPSPPGLTYMEWSAPPDADRDDPDVVKGSNPSMDEGLVDDALDRAMLSPEEYDRERLGIFPDGDDQTWDLFTEEDWGLCFSPLRGVWLGDPPTLAVEVTTDRRWASIMAAGPNPRGVAVEVVEHREVFERDDDGRVREWLVDRIVQLTRHKPKALLIDPRSPAGAYIRQLVERGVEVTEVSSQDYAKACATMQDAVRGHTVTHHDDAVLTAAAAAVGSRTLGDAWVFDRRGSTVTTPLSAAALALWGALELAKPAAEFDFII